MKYCFIVRTDAARVLVRVCGSVDDSAGCFIVRRQATAQIAQKSDIQNLYRAIETVGTQAPTADDSGDDVFASPACRGTIVYTVGKWNSEVIRVEEVLEVGEGMMIVIIRVAVGEVRVELQVALVLPSVRPVEAAPTLALPPQALGPVVSEVLAPGTALAASLANRFLLGKVGSDRFVVLIPRVVTFFSVNALHVSFANMMAARSEGLRQHSEIASETLGQIDSVQVVLVHVVDGTVFMRWYWSAKCAGRSIPQPPPLAPLAKPAPVAPIISVFET